ncbi:MAG: L-seryl-tRNA(Sec) selenium transferase, partial [Pseudomonadota bacterium]
MRRLPKVQTVLETDQAIELIQAFGYEDVAAAVRAQINRAREDIIAGAALSEAELSHQAVLHDILPELRAARLPSLRTAINATGIIIHTNLGRARLAPEAVQAMQ